MPEIPPPEDAPADPITALAEGAHQMHELFSSYVDAGFTRAEALDLLKMIMSMGIITSRFPGGAQ